MSGEAPKPVGVVADVRDEDFRLSRTGGEDVYVPYDAIRAMLGEQVVLDVAAAEMDAQGWPTPPAGS